MRLTVGPFHSSLLVLTLAALATGPSSMFANALPLTDNGVLVLGQFGGTLVGVTSVPLCIYWGDTTTNTNICSPAATHQMSVSGTSNLFSTATSTTDKIQDLNEAFSPTTGIFTGGPIIDFETVLGAGALASQTINFDLTQFVLANGGAGFGTCNNNFNNSCEPAGSPFTFTTDGVGDVTITFTVLMNAYTGTSSASGFTPYKGVFSDDLSGTLVGTSPCNGEAVNVTNILSCEAAGGTITDGTWSASESPATQTPEPLTFALFGSGLVGLGLIGRHHRRRA